MNVISKIITIEPVNVASFMSWPWVGARRGVWGAVRALGALLPAPPGESGERAGHVGESLAALASLAAL